MRIAVLSDTHGLLRPEVVEAVRGSDHILHAGDVGNPAILDELSAIAPLTAIRGNIDTRGACALLPSTEMIELDGTLVYMVHAIGDLDIAPDAAGVRAVIYGHSHKPEQRIHKGVLYLNPGSVGPRRFKLPISMAFLQIGPGTLQVQELRLDA